MNQEIIESYIKILHSELKPALGCTEPIAIALAAAKVRDVLGAMPQRIELYCSGNIVKNVKGVIVPNSGGMKGMEVAATLGVLGGNAAKELEVLESVVPDDIGQAKKLLDAHFCEAFLLEGTENLHIIAKAFLDSHCAEVEITNKHTNISRIALDGTVLFQQEECLQDGGQTIDALKELLTVKDIVDFAEQVDLDAVQDVLEAQIKLNGAVAEEGFNNPYGANVGKTLLRAYGDDVKVRARAFAAAGSDARMGGCTLPVIINSGSGNQGMTVSLPVIEYAKELGVHRNKLYRALLISNLISIHQKRYIGRLSAYCGAVSAACGSGAGIAYLYGGGAEIIEKTITNTIANVGGIVCDGAKASCAAKIAASVDAAILAYHLSAGNQSFAPGEGLVKGNTEDTIASIGRMGRVGMRSTDIEILNIMME